MKTEIYETNFQKTFVKKLIGLLNHCGATPITSVSFTSKLAFYIHKHCKKKDTKKIQSPKVF